MNIFFNTPLLLGVTLQSDIILSVFIDHPDYIIIMRKHDGTNTLTSLIRYNYCISE